MNLINPVNAAVSPALELPSYSNPLLELSSLVSSYDPVDLLTAVAALQLLPENAGRSIRLDRFAHAIAALPDQPSKPLISSGRLKAFCHSTQLATWTHQEDPFDNLFTQAFAFHGGSFIIFPGNADASSYVLLHLVKALFVEEEPQIDNRFIEEAGARISGVLALSDAIARRAGLPRGLKPTGALWSDIKVPDAGRLQVLKKAVSFNKAEFETLLGQQAVPPDSLAGITCQLGSVQLINCGLDTGDLLSRPIVQVGNQFIVAIPGMLISALRHEIIRLAQRYNVREELAKRYHQAVWLNVVHSLEQLGFKAIALPNIAGGTNPLSQSGLNFKEMLYSIDRDKVSYVLLLTDTLSDYNQREIFGEWKINQKLPELIQERLGQVEASIFSLSQPPAEIFPLILVEGVGHSFILSVKKEPSIVSAASLLEMGADELETISYLEAYNSLVLWKFARASSKRRSRSPLLAFGKLSEFAFYREHNYSYYHSDEALPSHTWIQPGGVGELRREVYQQRDWHAVLSYRPGFLTEVTSLYDTQEVPLYFSLADMEAKNLAILVEGQALPLWITGLTKEGSQHDWEEQGKLFSTYYEFGETIGYWLWQFSPSLASYFQFLSARYSIINFELQLDAETGWFSKTETSQNSGPLEADQFTPSPPIQVSADPKAGVIHIKLVPAAHEMLETADNGGERQLMQAILHGLAELVTEGKVANELLTVDEINDILERHAPLGLKKKILSLSASDRPDLDPRQLTRKRLLQQADINEVLDDLGDYLVSKAALKLDSIPVSERVAILNKAVQYCYGELEKLVGSLSPVDLLEWLVGQHEVLVRDLAIHNLTIPTRLECFGNTPGMIEKFRKENQDYSSASMTSRFVLEYIAAKPPTGLRPISLSVYDKLQALAWHIINFGFASDLLHYQLADFNLAILPSGRLGFDRGVFEKARESYIRSYIAGDVVRATQTFSTNWQFQDNQTTKVTEDEPEPPVLMAVLDEAAATEFGYSLTQLMTFLIEAINLSNDEQTPTLTCLAYSDFVERFVQQTGWTEQKVQNALELLCLQPRPTFLKPPLPYRGEDVYPWRFNRGLSYLRRPFLLRLKRDGTKEVLWGSRHVYNASRYLVELCMSGRLKANSEPMQKILGKINNQKGKEFNNAVAERLAGFPGLIVRKKVERIGQLDELLKLGDIDVIMVNTNKQVITAIECKDMALARTPHEMHSELVSLFETHRSKESIIQHHLLRVNWLRQHIPEILSWLKLDPTKKGGNKWRVEPLIVVDQELFTPYLRESPVKIVSFNELVKSVHSACNDPVRKGNSSNHFKRKKKRR